MSTMKAAKVTSPGVVEIVQVPIPTTGKGQVRIKVISCGICHSDNITLYGAMGTQLPRIPGHEVLGVVDEIGEGVTGLVKGQEVGVGWFGGNHCGKCTSCLQNEWILCKESLVCGLNYDGGYAEYCVAPADAIVKIPSGMDPIASSPLLCAGVTVYNSFRNQNIKSGSVVGVQGLGGLGHLAIQFVKKMGYQVAALSSGSSKEALARELGASYYFDMSNQSWVAECQKLDVKCILVTAPNGNIIPTMVKSLGINGKLVLLAAVTEPFSVDGIELLGQKKSIIGWASGDSRDTEDTFNFAKHNCVKPMVQPVSLEEAADRLKNISQAKFRYVISFQK
ncbi:hypothetical protein CYY_002330 [Polysphondylium violaceum]|uniref:Enoyl reductase (ER) domain-containing protein n=1 Tax=Polysphondylium violaceum TaxID=133409 RepID=A0A8J4PY97_9MYCE|nr:hypothetical protein CYY_002330 [Polysphondylium violaceum]